MNRIFKFQSRILVIIFASILCFSCNNADVGKKHRNVPLSESPKTNSSQTTISKSKSLITSGVIKPALYINSEEGSDKNPGTFKKPLKSIAEALKRVQKEPKSILFAGGQVFEGTIIFNGITGSDSAPLIIGSYGNGRAEINGNLKEALRIENCRFIHAENLYLAGRGRKDGNTTNGLQMQNSTDCVIENIIAEGFQKSGVDLYNCRNIRVLKTLALYNGFCGINVMGSERDLSGNILIGDCRAENNPGDPTNLDNHSGNGILVGVSDSVTIDHCAATCNGWDMPRQGNGPVGIWTWESDHVTIQHCISYRNKTSKGGKDGGGFDLDGGVRNSVIQYCLSYENQGAGYGLFQYPGASDWSDNVIRYCVSINDAHVTEGAGSFFIWNGTNDKRQLANCYIYNNVAFNKSVPVVSFESASDHVNFTFMNNIFLDSGEMISGTNKGSRFTGNVWWSVDGRIKLMKNGSLKEWADQTGQEMIDGRIAGIEVDPGLKGPFLAEITDPYLLKDLTGFTLKQDSPVRNRGLEIKGFAGANSQGFDFFGNPVPMGQGPEPGIHEID